MPRILKNGLNVLQKVFKKSLRFTMSDGRIQSLLILKSQFTPGQSIGDIFNMCSS